MSVSAKLALWVPIIIVVIAIGLWLAGGKKQEYSAAIQIDANPDIVFASIGNGFSVFSGGQRA